MKKTGLIAAGIVLFSLAAPPLEAYVGPGAGFAFLSSFLVLFLTFLLALFSFLSWPFRFLWRAVRGQRAYKKGAIERLVILGLDGLEPTLAERFMAEGKLPMCAEISADVLDELKVGAGDMVYASLKGRVGGELHALALETSAPG